MVNPRSNVRIGCLKVFEQNCLTCAIDGAANTSSLRMLPFCCSNIRNCLLFLIFTSIFSFNTIYFFLQSFEGPEMYMLIGVLCGLAIYNSIIIDLPFPVCLYKKLLNRFVFRFLKSFSKLQLCYLLTY